VNKKTLPNAKKSVIPQTKVASKEPSLLMKNLLKNVAYCGPKKLFVLDTNVLMHDPMSVFRFQEHDVYIPMMTLEELDGHKKGQSEVARNARQVSRTFDELISQENVSIKDGIDLNEKSHGQSTGRLFFQAEVLQASLPDLLPTAKADNQIIGVVIALKKRYPKREVILVSKDINMRIKANTIGQVAQDYFSDKVLEDTDLLYSGATEIPENFWVKNVETWKDGGHDFFRVRGKFCSQLFVNEFVWQDGDRPFRAIVHERVGQTAILRTFKDYMHPKNAVWGITARNREQSFALCLLMDPDIDFVSLSGQAGTGKTLLTLAVALDQTLNRKLYSDIIFTRVTMPIGEDIGFLPGTEEEKMLPWMGAMEDNLDVLGLNSSLESSKEGGKKQTIDWNRIASTADLIRSRLKVKSLNFMRGRTFVNKFIIIDEAQNLTPHQVKTLVTRAGPGTKMVCLGNISQIDTPYLTEGGSGLTYIVDRFKDWEYGGHVTLLRGERSRLADHAAEVL